MSKPDGGPAFPNTHTPPVAEPKGEIQHGSGWVGSSGMTLRDYFAAKALQGELTAQPRGEALYEQTPENSMLMARRAYLYADAMIAERSRPDAKA